MRKVILVSALCIPLTSQDETGSRIIKFDKPYDRFVRAYFGCPAEGYFEGSDCKPSRAETDYVAFTKACHAAAELFHLKDTCAE
jgi:hypothetical protein